MNTGQMMITIASLMLLSIVVLTINRNFLTTNSSLLTNKQTLSATSLATSIIEEASGKAFDENTLGGKSITNANVFTSLLGPETNEKYNAKGANEFDDFDDFDGLQDSIDIPGSGTYKFWVKVNYIKDNLTITSSKQFNKILTVKVSNEGMMSDYFNNSTIPDSVTMSFIYSYWF